MKFSNRTPSFVVIALVIAALIYTVATWNNPSNVTPNHEATTVTTAKTAPSTTTVKSSTTQTTKTTPSTTKTAKVVKHRKVKAVSTTTVPAKTVYSTTTTTPVETITTTPAVGTQSVRADIDPSYTQNASNPLKVTWTFSASVTNGLLPDGTLELTVETPNSVALSGGCTANVGGLLTTSSCTITLPNYGLWEVVVTYAGSIYGSTATEIEDIEAPVVTTTTTTVPPTTTTTAPPNSVTVTWSSWSDGGAYTQHGTGAPTNPLSMSGSQTLTLYVSTVGSVSSDSSPLGTLDFSVTGPSTPIESSDYDGTCQAGDNFSGQAEDGCSFNFSLSGTYYISVKYVSSDSNYVSTVGPTTEVDVY